MTQADSTHRRMIALATGQHGVVSRGQLLGAGFTSGDVRGHVRAGRLRSLHRGVYLLGQLVGALEPERAREMAAVLACGPGAVVSHTSAALLWGLLKIRDEIHVTVPRAARRRRPGICVHRACALTAGETTRLEGIPVTTPARTLRDLSTVVGAPEVSRAAARAERRGLVAPGELTAILALHRGRPGARRLRFAIGGEAGPAFTRSEAEDRFLALIRSGGLPAPETNVVIARHEVDFLWRAEGLAVEVDGFAYHGSRRSFEHDRRRDAELAAAGIRVIRVTWRQLVEEPAAVLVRVAQALARARREADLPRAGR